MEIGREEAIYGRADHRVLREVDAGVTVKGLCRRRGFSAANFYRWRAKFGGMSVPDAKRLRTLEVEDGRLKKLVAELLLETEVTREALRKKLWMSSKGLSER